MNKAVQLEPATPDWSREKPRKFWDPSRRLVKSIRCYQKWAARRGVIAAIMKRRWVLSHIFWSVVTAADIPLNCQIGGGVVLPHPTGVVVSDKAIIGVNCVLFQGITIVGHVSVGNHSNICSGAKLIRPGVTIGDHSIVGANSVVLASVPDYTVVAGAPAREIISTRVH